MTKKKRILHVITRLDPGGSTMNTLETVARLDPGRFEVDLVSGLTSDPLAEATGFMARHGISCRYVRSLRRDINPFWDMCAFIALILIMRRGGYDIVHTHSSKAGILGRWAARLSGIKHVVHTPHGHVFYGYFLSWVTRFFVGLERAAARITDRLVALTSKGIEEHLSFKVGIRSQWVAIPSGIDLKKFFYVAEEGQRVRRSLGIARETLVFVSVARLEPVKGNVHLIEAMAEVVPLYPSASLVLVGDGSEREMLIRKARDLGIAGNVVFAGAQRDVVPFLSAGDVFVLGSLNEGMGRAVVEAMACGLPSIVSNTGGLPELIEDGKEGFLAGPGESWSFALAMRKLANDKDLRKIMSDRARQKADMKFSIKTMVHSIETLYEGLVR
jgi:glycosyltransferase involved in cell wall biosynthesis